MVFGLTVSAVRGGLSVIWAGLAGGAGGRGELSGGAKETLGTFGVGSMAERARLARIST